MPRSHLSFCYTLQTDVDADCNCEGIAHAYDDDLAAYRAHIEHLETVIEDLRKQNAKYKSILEACHLLTDVAITKL